MDNDKGLALVARCTELAPIDLLALFGDLLSEDPHATTIPALAMRELARRGQVSDDFVPILVACIVDAPNLACFTHLAKALAAFGPAAEMATPYLVDKARGLQITNDRRFWVLDSVLHALSYTGGDAAEAFLDELSAENPARVLKSKSVYDGNLSDDDRLAIFEDTLEEARVRATDPDRGGWVTKNTAREKSDPKEAPKRTAPWMTR